MRPNLSALFAALALTPFSASAKLAVKGTPDVHFFATGPGGLTIDGKTADLTVADDGTKAVFTVALKKLETGIALRDEHTRKKYLQVDTYPDATLELLRGDVKLPEPGKRGEGEVKGTYTCHGKSQPVTVKYKIRRDKDGLDVDGRFKINIKDHGIDVPSYLGVTVRPEMEIQVKFQATDG